MKSILTIILLVSLIGCSPIGPGTITRDRFDYSTDIARSWQQQMLFNIVKLRYADTPVFMDVTSVINQYSLEGNIDLRANFQTGADSTGLGAAGKYYDRPTITYTPLTGDKFTRNLMTPMKPGVLMSLVQAGWPIDFIFWLNLKAINGLHNRSSTRLFARPADPKFVKLLQSLRRIQKSDAIGLRVKKTDDGVDTLMVIRREGLAGIEEERLFLQEALGLAPDLIEARLVFGLLSRNDHEIAMLTRSMLEILGEMAFGVDVPAEHIAENRATSAPAISEEDAGLPKLIHIKCDRSKPADAFVSVPYRGEWFWIDDRDIESKRMFTFLMILFSLAETGSEGSAPIVTIPVG